MTNPLNDDDYDTNDPQIEDLKALVRALAGALDNIRRGNIAKSFRNSGEYAADQLEQYFEEP